MCLVSELMQQDFNFSVRKLLAYEPHDAHVIFQEFICIVGDLFTVVFLKQLDVNLLFSRLELRPHIVLLADKNQLPRGCMIFVLEEVMHAQPEIFQAELAEVFARYCERIEIVLVQVSAELAASLFVLAPQKTERQKEQRYDDRRDDVDRKLALQGIDHSLNILCAAVATGLWPVISTARRSTDDGSQSSWLQRLLPATLPDASQISSQTRQRDVLDQRVHRTRQGEYDGVGHLGRAHHFLAWPLTFDLGPDVGVSRGGGNVDDANFWVAQVFAHATRKTFDRKLAHAIGAPVRERGLRGNRKDVDDARPRRHTRRKALR